MPDQFVSHMYELSFRAKRGICFFLALAAITCPPLFSQTPRPKILAIHSVQISVSDYCRSVDFYSSILGGKVVGISSEIKLNASGGAASGVLGKREIDHANCPSANQEDKWLVTAFPLRSGQDLGVGSHGTPNSYKLINEFSFVIDDAPALLQYLKSQGVEANYSDRYGTSVTARDPDGHVIVFVDHNRTRSAQALGSAGDPRRIIHIGFAVWHQESTQHFYKDILGFRPYWHGGRTDERDDWVSLQVPDGSDWVEFMLNVPDDADKRQLGVANHIALGVTDIQAAKAQLVKNGTVLTEEPKIGRGGKWQMNLYDPDGTRIEFMEFTPVQKPCCSEYTAPHPKP